MFYSVLLVLVSQIALMFMGHPVKGNTINHFYDCNVQYGSDSIAIRVQGDPTKFLVLVFLKVDLHLDIG